MIAIDRGRAKVPASFLQKGPKERDEVIRPKAVKSPPTLKSSDFKSSVYGSKAVKEQLWKMQAGKCCFCEKWLEISFATVEHFRPKTSAKDDQGNVRGGYWWLGFEFENLYLCCSNCNTPKSNYFPLAAGSVPLKVGELQSTSQAPEDYLILDPGVTDPEPHIGWVFVPGKGYMPHGIGARGEVTLKVTQLATRDKLALHRGRYYKTCLVPLLRRYKRAKANNDLTRLKEATDDAKLVAEWDSPFAGMTRFLLREQGML